MQNHKVVLITGAAKRIGAAIARLLHSQNMNIIIHYRHAEQAAQDLCAELNHLRQHSAAMLKADLNAMHSLAPLISAAYQQWNRFDVLINNASSFFPTPIGDVAEAQWEDLFNSNLKAPFFLTQSAVPFLKQHNGCVVNITDIRAQRPLKHYSVYCAAKAGLAMLTQALAKELAPEIRVNSVAPGSILWPNSANHLSEAKKQEILHDIPLHRQGQVEDIAKAVLFLINDAHYITGQTIVVDGGRLLNC